MASLTRMFCHSADESGPEQLKCNQTICIILADRPVYIWLAIVYFHKKNRNLVIGVLVTPVQHTLTKEVSTGSFSFVEVPFILRNFPKNARFRSYSRNSENSAFLGNAT